jgi:hypothetical protein
MFMFTSISIFAFEFALIPLMLMFAFEFVFVPLFQQKSDLPYSKSESGIGILFGLPHSILSIENTFYL